MFLGSSCKAVSAANFANVNNNGNCNNNNASNSNGVRPDFTTTQHWAKFPRVALRKEGLSIRNNPINTNHDGAGYDQCAYSVVLFIYGKCIS